MYNISMDICALVLYSIALILIFTRKRIKSKQNLPLIILIGMCILVTITDIVSAECLNNAKFVPLWCIYASNYLYYLLQGVGTFAYLVYIVILLGQTNKLKKPSYGVMIFTPLVLLTVSLLANGWTDIIFYIDENLKSRQGNMFWFLYAVSFWNISLAVFFIAKNKAVLPKVKRISLYSFVPLAVIPTALQMFFPQQLLTGFATAICVLLVVTSIETKGEIIDGNTGLFNRASFFSTASIDLKSGKSREMLLVYIKNYKTIKRLYGAVCFSNMESQIGEFFKSNFFRNIQVFYQKEGELRIILPYNIDILAQTIEKIDKRFEQPWKLDVVNIKLNIIMCAINCPSDASTVEEISNIAQYFKRINTQKNIVYASEIDKQELKQTEVIEKSILRAIENKSFEVNYQPIYDSESGKPVLLEALVRLKDSEFGAFSPTQFIPIAEKNGWVLKVGRIMFEKVCAFISNTKIYERGIEGVNVNLSVVQGMQENMADELLEIIDKYKVPPHIIIFEVTETVAIYSADILMRNMQKLKKYGVRFALDDYGAGYSSMQNVVEYPFDIIKIDKSLVQNTLSPQKQIAFVATINMLKQLQKKIIAEGVEEIEQANNAKTQGCDYMQGFLYSYPLSSQQLLKII